MSLEVATVSPSQYKVLYTAVNRGQHKLYVRINSRGVNGSPFTVTVYPDPIKIGHPVRVVTGLNRPYGIAFNNHGEMIVTEYWNDCLSIFDIRKRKIRSFGSHNVYPKQMKFPQGVAIDDSDNIYVSSRHKLQKFTSSGNLIKSTGKRGNKDGEFGDPRGVTLYDNHVYVCDRSNHRIQEFDMDLNFTRSIGSHGEGRGRFSAPYDVKFDMDGNMYIVEYENKRVQVMDKSGRYVRTFGDKGKGKLKGPSAVHIVDKHVYVSDLGSSFIVVYEMSGQFVTSFGKPGDEEGELNGPYSIASCADGFLYVCDFLNDRVQIF